MYSTNISREINFSCLRIHQYIKSSVLKKMSTIDAISHYCSSPYFD